MKLLADKSSYHAVRNYLDAVSYAVPGNSVGWLPHNYYEGGFQSMKGHLLVINTKDLPEKYGFVSLCVVPIPPRYESGTFIRVSTATNLSPAEKVGGTTTPIQHKGRLTFAVFGAFIAGMILESCYSIIRESCVIRWIKHWFQKAISWIKN